MIWEYLHKYRVVLFVLVLTATAVSAPWAGRLQTDPSNSAVFEHDTEYDQNLFFQKTFGSDDSVVIGLGDTAVLTGPVIDWIADLTAWLSENDAVMSVQSITSTPRVERHMLSVTSGGIAEKYLAREESLEDYTNQLRVNSDLNDYLLNESRTFTAVIAYLKSDLGADGRSLVIKDIEKRLSEHAPPAGKISLSGTALEQDRFIEKIEHDHDVFVPITFGLIMLTLLLLHGHPRALIYPAFVIAATLVTTQAFMALSGIPMNMMTTLVAPVILIVSVGDVVHLQSHARHAGLHKRPEKLLRAAFHSMAAPCLLTSLTTMAGFLSLLFNRVPAVREFGMFAALGTGLALLWTFILAPFFFTAHVRKSAESFNRTWGYASAGLTAFTLKHRRIVLVAGVLVFIAGLAGMRMTRVETDILGSFKADDAFRLDTEKIHSELGGVYTLELILQSPGISAFSDGESLRQAVQLQKAIGLIPGVSHVKYLTDVIRAIDRGIRGEDSAREELPPAKYLSRYLGEMSSRSSPLFARIATKNYEWTRMTAFLTLSSTAAVSKTAEEIRRMAGELLPEGWRLFVTGQTYLLARMSQRLVKGTIVSLLAAMAVIWLLLVVWTRSLKVGAIALFVNAVPMAVVFGSMPFLKIPLNTATAMIGAVAVGLIVDSTIHVLFRFREAEGAFSGSDRAIEHVMNYCAQPIISSALILMMGFSVTLMGTIQPTVQFGLLMVMMIFAALISNLLLLPALLAGRNKESAYAPAL